MIQKIIVVLLLFGTASQSLAQTLHLPDALARSVSNYEKIKSKEALTLSAAENTRAEKTAYLPELTLMAQQSFGTINAQNGPLYAYGGLGAASTSMPLPEQNWNAAFGSLYLANINWDLFTFGRNRNKVEVAEAGEAVYRADLQQEIFNHQAKVAAAYFNLLASQRVKYVQERNLERAQVLLNITQTLSASGLIPEVDASLARAEASEAKSAIIKAHDLELEHSKTLAVLMGEGFKSYELDGSFLTEKPLILEEGALVEKHPSLVLQKTKLQENNQQEALLRSNLFPKLSAFGVFQGRGSGFDWNYIQDNTAFSSQYTDGVGIDRSNYIAGISLSWNLTNTHRQGIKLKQQKWISESVQHDLNLLEEEIKLQGELASAKLLNAREQLEESKIQLSAAQEAYKQQKALYENGLINIVDFTQSLYSLNRAEVSNEIAQNNIWQAILLKAAANGDMSLLLSALKN